MYKTRPTWCIKPASWCTQQTIWWKYKNMIFCHIWNGILSTVFSWYNNFSHCPHFCPKRSCLARPLPFSIVVQHVCEHFYKVHDECIRFIGFSYSRYLQPRNWFPFGDDATLLTQKGITVEYKYFSISSRSDVADEALILESKDVLRLRSSTKVTQFINQIK